MSFPELLDAARALPRAEQIQLANALLDHVPAGERPTHDEALLAAMFSPGTPVIDICSQYDACDAAVAIKRLLDEAEGK